MRNGELQAFLDFGLAQYLKEGVSELDQDKLPELLELKFHAVANAAQELGGETRIREAFVGFQQRFY
ncbi:MAG: hypothetical protein H6960_05600 [Chromatiaceae bacterium]|nr:hypothetical protein [Chromatiaceae bacterium]MCP5439737.1 hypothetical protein [Chromatiaceae bacterium]